MLRLYAARHSVAWCLPQRLRGESLPFRSRRNLYLSQRCGAGLLDPEIKLEVLGHAEVRDVFRVSKVGMIAGCYVTDGSIERHQQIRVTRDGIVVEADRKLDQLKRFKDDAKEVKAG